MNIDISEEAGVRYLHFGSSWVQGAMRIARPQAIELEYVQRMLAWMLWRPEAALAQGHAVQLGLGAATLTRFCHQRLRMEATTAVEINPSVIAACRQWFRLPTGMRVNPCELSAGRQVLHAPSGRGTFRRCIPLVPARTMRVSGGRP